MYVRAAGKRAYFPDVFDGHGLFIEDKIICMRYIKKFDPALFRLNIPSVVEENQHYTTTLTSVEHNQALGLEKFIFNRAGAFNREGFTPMSGNLLCLAKKPLTVTLEVIKTNVPWRSEPDEV